MQLDELIPKQTEQPDGNNSDSNNSDNETQKKKFFDNFRQEGVSSLNHLIELRGKNQLSYPILANDPILKSQAIYDNKKTRLDDWNFSKQYQTSESMDYVKKQLDQEITVTNKIIDQEPYRLIQ